MIISTEAKKAVDKIQPPIHDLKHTHTQNS